MTLSPAWRARTSVCSSSITKQALPGASSRDELKCLRITQQVVAHVPHAIELDAVAPPGHEHARMCASKGVKVVQVEQVPYPPVDAEQVERGRRDEIQRHSVRVKERADVRESLQRAAGLALRPPACTITPGRGDVEVLTRRNNRGACRGAASSATALKRHTFISPVCALFMALSKCGLPDAGRATRVCGIERQPGPHISSHVPVPSCVRVLRARVASARRILGVGDQRCRLSILTRHVNASAR